VIKLFVSFQKTLLFFNNILGLLFSIGVESFFIQPFYCADDSKKMIKGFNMFYGEKGTENPYMYYPKNQ
jgi:hypothetical protein